jgi:hypothetical protein
MTSRNRPLRWFSILLIGLACACVLLRAVPARAQVWQTMGPAGGDVRALASDPAHPEVLYLGTTDGAIFTSRDAGADWEPLGMIGENQNAVVTAILVARGIRCGCTLRLGRARLAAKAVEFF